MTSSRSRSLGFLYPGFAAEDDYPRMGEMLDFPVQIHVVHTTVGEDAHRVDALLDLGGHERLAQGALLLQDAGVDAAVWACTSGSFVFGWEGAREQVSGIQSLLGVPASSTSFAFVNAIEALGVRRVAIAATYPADVAGAFAEFLAEAGIEVVSTGSQGIITATEVGTLGRDRVLSFVAAGDLPEAEAVLVPDTALHTADWLEDLEEKLGKPVLTANQVTLFEALRLTGGCGPQKDLGTLFRRGVPAPVEA